MKFLLGLTNSIGKAAFARAKLLLSAVSVALTSGLVLLLEVSA